MARMPQKKRRSRLAEFKTRFAAHRSRGQMVDHEAELGAPGTPADVSSVRAKSSRHGKSTADKWNR